MQKVTYLSSDSMGVQIYCLGKSWMSVACSSGHWLWLPLKMPTQPSPGIFDRTLNPGAIRVKCWKRKIACGYAPHPPHRDTFVTSIVTIDLSHLTILDFYQEQSDQRWCSDVDNEGCSILAMHANIQHISSSSSVSFNRSCHSGALTTLWIHCSSMFWDLWLDNASEVYKWVHLCQVNKLPVLPLTKTNQVELKNTCRMFGFSRRLKWCIEKLI